MAETGKKVEVRFGAFSCSIEGYDNPVEQMREVLLLMQRMIHETPALADNGPGFGEAEVARIEDALDRRASRQAADGPGIVVIRGAEIGRAEPAEPEDAVTTAEIPPEGRAPAPSAPMPPDLAPEQPPTTPEAVFSEGDGPGTAPGRTDEADAAARPDLAVGAAPDTQPDPSGTEPSAGAAEAEESRDAVEVASAADVVHRGAPADAPPDLSGTGDGDGARQAESDRWSMHDDLPSEDGDKGSPAGPGDASAPAEQANRPCEPVAPGDPAHGKHAPAEVARTAERASHLWDDVAEAPAAPPLTGVEAIALEETSGRAAEAETAEHADRPDPETARTAGTPGEDPGAFADDAPEQDADTSPTDRETAPDAALFAGDDPFAGDETGTPSAAEGAHVNRGAEDEDTEGPAAPWQDEPRSLLEERDAAEAAPAQAAAGAGPDAPAPAPSAASLHATQGGALDGFRQAARPAPIGFQPRPAASAATGASQADHRDADEAPGAARQADQQAPSGGTADEDASRQAGDGDPLPPAGEEPAPAPPQVEEPARRHAAIARDERTLTGTEPPEDGDTPDSSEARGSALHRAGFAPPVAGLAATAAARPRPAGRVVNIFAPPPAAGGDRMAAWGAPAGPSHGSSHGDSREAARQPRLFARPGAGGSPRWPAAVGLTAPAREEEPAPDSAWTAAAGGDSSGALPVDEPDDRVQASPASQAGLSDAPGTRPGSRPHLPGHSGSPNIFAAPQPHAAGRAASLGDPDPASAAAAERPGPSGPDADIADDLSRDAPDGDDAGRRSAPDEGADRRATDGSDEDHRVVRLDTGRDGGAREAGPAGATAPVGRASARHGWNDGLDHDDRGIDEGAGARARPNQDRSRFSALLARLGGHREPEPAPPSRAGEPRGLGEVGPEDLAERAGARSVSDLLAVAAAWLTLVEGKQRFTRREVMETYERLPGDHPRTLEARIKGFGKLVRSSVLILVDDGVFAMAQSERDRFQAMIDTD